MLPLYTQREFERITHTFENIVHRTINKVAPIIKDGDQYKFKNYRIKEHDGKWRVFILLDEKHLIAETFLKITAFTIVKLHDKRDINKLKEVILNDELAEKNYTDKVIFEHVMNTSRDRTTRDTARWRFEIVTDLENLAIKRIKHLFYGVI